MIRGERQGNRVGGLLKDTVGVGSSLKALPKVDHSANVLHKTIPTPQHYSVSHLATFLVEDLIRYLDPEYIGRIAMPDASKLQFVLAGSAGQCVHVHLGMWIVGEAGDRDGLPVSPLMDTALEAALWNSGLALG